MLDFGLTHLHSTQIDDYDSSELDAFVDDNDEVTIKAVTVEVPVVTDQTIKAKVCGARKFVLNFDD